MPDLQMGVFLPQDELTTPSELFAWAEGIEELGFRYVVMADHVVGLDPTIHPQDAPFGRAAPYTTKNRFLDPFVLVSALAARTGLRFMTAVMPLPQRQAVLVAKQAATLSWLSEERFSLGVGLGYLEPEFQALGVAFEGRARRFEEQIAVMRELWREPVATFEGEHHSFKGVGLNPRPTSGAVPLWIGASTHAAPLKRVGRLADGWLPLRVPGHGFEDDFAVVSASAAAAGRAMDDIGIEGRVQVAAGSPAVAARRAVKWFRAGATQVSVDCEGAHFQGVSSHLEGLAAVLNDVREQADV